MRLSALSFLYLCSYASASCMHATSKLKRRLTEEGKVEVAKFGYTNLQGPLNWAGLEAENSACNTGANQSPINLNAAVSKAAETPIVEIANVAGAEFENLGTTVEVLATGKTTFAGAEFTLKQFHFHTPSEHRINDEYFPLEMHMVHEAADGSGNIAVIGVLFQLSEDGSTTDLLTAVTENIEAIAVPGTVGKTGALDFSVLSKHVQTTPLFQYTGSLTTPPCAEGLTFLVTEQPLPLNVATFNKIKSVVKFNSRYTQNELGVGNLLVGSGVFPAFANGSTAAASGQVALPTATTSAAMVHETKAAETKAAVVQESKAAKAPAARVTEAPKVETAKEEGKVTMTMTEVVVVKEGGHEVVKTHVVAEVVQPTAAAPPAAVLPAAGHPMMGRRRRVRRGVRY